MENLITFTEKSMGIMIGVSLGKKITDATSISVAEGSLDKEEESFVVQTLERARLGTDYTVIGKRIAVWFDTVTAAVDKENKRRKAIGDQGGHRQEPLASPQVFINATGMGTPFINDLRRTAPQVQIVAVTISSGDKDNQSPVDEGYEVLNIGREALIFRLQMLLGSKKIGFPSTALGEELAGELQVFTGKTKDRGEPKDLVIAAALSVWERPQTWNERVQLWL